MSKQVGAGEMRQIADGLVKQLPGLAFVLIVFEVGERKGKGGNYISNAERSNMIDALKETVYRLENKQDFTTPEPN